MNYSPIFLRVAGRILILLFVLGMLFSAAVLTSVISTPVKTSDPSSPYVYSFNSAGTLQEAPSLGESTSPYWWVDSGGGLVISNGVGATLSGSAPAGDRWRLAYARSSFADTDGGLHPQNLFRLVARSTWTNVAQESSFYIDRDNLSASSNRNASNGLLLMSRYQDGSTLYYAGVRVDGTAVIKKKYKGVYYTMAQKAVFPGTYQGWQDNKNLLPHNEWIGLRSETVTLADGSTKVLLYMRREGQSGWTLLLSAVDRGQYGGTAPITAAGHTGIRTDFMDVRFDSYRLEEI